MSTVHESAGGSLSEVAPLEPRRRKKEVEKRLDDWEESSVNLYRELIPHPTQTWLIPTGTASRARNRGRCNPFFQSKRAVLDPWGRDELTDEQLLLVATHYLGFCMELMRISGRQPTAEAVADMARSLFQTDNSHDAVLVDAIGDDGVVDEEEAPELIEACEEQEASTRMLRITLQSALHAGYLPSPDQVEESA